MLHLISSGQYLLEGGLRSVEGEDSWRERDVKYELKDGTYLALAGVKENLSVSYFLAWEDQILSTRLWTGGDGHRAISFLGINSCQKPELSGKNGLKVEILDGCLSWIWQSGDSKRLEARYE